MFFGWRWLKPLSLYVLLLQSGPSHAVTGPQALSIGGELITAAGQPITQTNVNFRILVYDPSAACVLYSEEHLAENLSASAGHFNLILGSGTSRVNNVGTAGALDNSVFVNSGTTTVVGCATSPLNLASGQGRQIQIFYDLGSGFTAMTPTVPVVASAYAMVADTLNGLPSTAFIQTNGTSSLNQANEEYAFSLTNWPRLKALLDGTSSQYLPSTPTVPLDVNGQRITDVADPTAAQDAATKHYVDANLGGHPLDQTSVGPMVGGGSTLIWDQTANKWTAGTPSSAPTGAAGGDLTGTYPNPTVANDKITSAKINSTGIAVNRLIITNPSDGTTLGYGACTVAGQVYAWTASGWTCSTVSSLAPVTSVAGKTGAVTLNAADVSGLGTSALFDWGTSANQIVRLDGSARLPVVDGSQLLNVNAVQLQGRGVASTAPTAGQVLGWNGSAWLPVGAAGGSVVGIANGVGLLGGPITTSGTLSVDVGTAANQILQLNASAQVPAVDGSLLTGVNAVTLQSRAVASTAPAGGQVLGWNASTTRWEPFSAATGSVTNIATGVGLLGGPISSIGTLSVDVGTAANKIVQENASAQIAQSSGSPGAPTYSFANNSNTGIYNPSADQIGFVAGAVPVATITSVGLGINTSTPQAALDIAATGTAGSAILIPRDSTLNRPSGVNGMLRYNTSSNAFEGFANNAWSTIAAGTAAGTVTNIANGVGLLGGPISTSGTLSVDVGTAANKIVQENANAQIAQSFGSAALPAYSFSSNTNTGIFSPGAGQIALSANGTAALNVLASGFVGIGTATPTHAFEVNSSDVMFDVGDYGLFGVGQFNIEPLYGDYYLNKNARKGAWWVNQSPFQPSSQIAMMASGDVSINVAGPVATNATLPFVTGLMVKNSGLVGVGTQTPAAALDVVSVGTNSALIVPRDTTGNRPSGVNGMLRYNTTNNGLEGFINGGWSAIAAGTSAGTVTNVASGVGLLGGPITTLGTLSVDVGTAANKIVQQNGSAQIAQDSGSALAPSYTFAGNTGSGLYSPALNQLALSTSGTASLFISSNGTVGIGTNAPAALLHVNGGMQVKGAITSTGSPVNTLLLSNNQIDAGGLGILSQDSTNVTIDYDNSGVGAFAVRKGTTNPATATNLFYVANSGSVAIGGTAPLAILDVAATGSASAIVVPRDTTGNRPSGVNGMLRYNTSSNAFEGFANNAWSTIAAGSTAGTVTNIASGVGLLGGPISTSGTLSVDVGTAANKIVQENANAQIAQSAGTAVLPAYSFAGNTNTGLFSPGANQLALSTNGTTALTVSANGYVGIGSTSPAGELQVTGSGATPTIRVTKTGYGAVLRANFDNDKEFELVTAWNNSTVMQSTAQGQIASFPNRVMIGATGTWNSAQPTQLAQLYVAGTVGIGTNTPAAGLDVALTGTAASAIIVPRDTTGNRPGGVNGMLRYNTSSNAFEGYANNAWSTIAAGTAAGTVTSVTSGTGLIGGPITSAGTLSVNVGTAANQIVQENTNAQIAQSNGTATSPSFSFAGSPSTGLYSPAANQMTMVANGTAALSITANGNVGINQTAPNFKTEFSSEAALNQFGSNSNNAQLVLSGAVNEGKRLALGVDTSASPMVGIIQSVAYTVGMQTLALNPNGGNVAINTTLPAAALDVAATGSTSAIIVPRDTTGNRPAGVNGMLRYNTTNNALEAYANGSWGALGTSTSSSLSTPPDFTATASLAAGAGALAAQTAGSATAGNTAFGYKAIGNASLTNTAYRNTAVGYQAGLSVTTGVDNTMIGYNAKSGTAGNEYGMTVVGSNTTISVGGSGGNSTIVGANTTCCGGGTGASVFGAGAAANNNGAEALGTQASAYGNASLAVGLSAATNADNTVAVGAYAKTTGTNGVTVGANAGSTNISGASNVLIGPGVGSTTLTTGQNNILIGTNNTVTTPAASTSRFLNVGNTIYGINVGTSGQGLVGIGTTAPLAVLDVYNVGTSSALIVPRDTTGNRPAGVNGMIRYNTSNNGLEGYINGSWSAIAAGSSAGTVTNIASGTGLLGGPITTSGTLSVNVGTAANQIVQENANAQIAQNIGSASLPSYAFAGNTNTGLYSPGTNQLALATNGTAALSVTGAGLVGIGSASPAYTLDVDGIISSQSFIQIAQPNYQELRFNGGAGNQWRAISGIQGATNGGLVFQNTTNDFSSVFTNSLAMATNGNVGVGTQTPQAALDVAITGTSSAIIVPRDTTGNRPGGANGMLRYNTTNNAFEGYQAGTWTNLIGSGTSAVSFPLRGPNGSATSPTYSFASLTNTGFYTDGWSIYVTQNGVNRAAFDDVNFSSYGPILANNGAVATPDYAFNGDVDTGVYHPATNTLGLVTNGTARMLISPTGFIGVGTAAPAAAFDVYALGTAASAIVVPRDTTTNRPTGVNGMLRYNTTNNAFEGYQAGAWTNLVGGGSVTFPLLASPGTTSSAAPSYSFSGNANTGMYSPATNSLALTVNGTAALSITNGGNVGIGTTAPGTPLEVNGLVKVGQIRSTNGSNTYPDFSFNSDNQTGLFLANIGVLGFATGSTERARIDASGNFGIGSTSPQTTLDVNGGVAMNATYEGADTAYATSGTAYTIPNATTAIRRITLTGNATITLPAFTTPTTKIYSMTVFLKQDGTGGRTVVFAGNGSDTVKWDSNVAPTITSAAGKITIIQLMKPSDENVWYGSMVWKEQ